PIAGSSYGSTKDTSQTGGRVDMTVDHIQIEGPFTPSPPEANLASRKRIFICRPISQAEELPCARLILSTLARRAYRRPLVDGDINVLLVSFAAGRKEGGDFESGIQRALESILWYPDFLFRVEHPPAGTAPGALFRL